jgi:hypothetical protein
LAPTKGHPKHKTRIKISKERKGNKLKNVISIYLMWSYNAVLNVGKTLILHGGQGFTIETLPEFEVPSSTLTPGLLTITSNPKRIEKVDHSHCMEKMFMADSAFFLDCRMFVDRTEVLKVASSNT